MSRPPSIFPRCVVQSTPRLLFALSFATLFVSLVPGCGGSSERTGSTPCRTDADCSPTEKCDFARSPGEQPARLPINPCTTLTACADSTGCAEGLVCGPLTQAGLPSQPGCPAMVCTIPCANGGCQSDETCDPGGVCEVTRCDTRDTPVCPDHWRCDPAAAATESTDHVAGAVEASDPARAVSQGCVRRRCDEDDGFTCLDGWECAPSRSLEATGCAAIPCDVLGHCSSDAFICSPTSTAPHPSFIGDLDGGKDAFGCVRRNCEEGHPCLDEYNGQDLGYCDPSAPNADSYGCAVHGCLDVPNICASDRRCAPSAANADRVGCVLLCEEGTVCQSGDWHSCVPLR